MPTPFSQRKAAPTRRNGLARETAGVEEQGTQAEAPQEPGRSQHFSWKYRTRKPEKKKIRGLRESRACAQEPARDTNKACIHEYRGAKENEATRNG